MTELFFIDNLDEINKTANSLKAATKSMY